MTETALFQERLTQLVAAPSISCTSPDIDMSNKTVIDVLANLLADIGFNCEVLPVPGEIGKYNLLASIGSGAGGLVLSGHSDTVPYDSNRWQQDPFTLKNQDQRFYGLGATDMKGFFPVVMAAVENLKDQLQHIQQPLFVLATADEESSMSGARAIAEAGMPKARCAVIGEPTGMRPIRMHKGIMMEKIVVQGLAGHSSNPKLGHNALESMHTVIGELLRFRAEMQDKYRNPGFEVAVPTLNLGCIHGGDNPNRICGHSELQFDLRPLPGMNIDALHQEIARRIEPLGAETGTTVQLEKLFDAVSPFEEPATSDLVRTAESLTGHTAESVAFATEAPFLQALGMETIVMGPGSIDQAHQPNEFIDHSQIGPAVSTIQSLIGRYCIEPT